MSAALDLLRRLEPHLDTLVCYASTTSEYEPNKLVQEVRALLGAARAERHAALMEAAAIAENILFAKPASPTERAFNTGIESAAKCIRQAAQQEPKP